MNKHDLEEVMSGLSDSTVEAQLISTLMYHPDYIYHSPYLKAAYFYNKDNHCLYWAINELYRRKITKIDAINIENVISSNQAIKKTWERYHAPDMQQYIDLCALSKRDSIEEYKMLVDRVVELAFKRDFYKRTIAWQNECVNPDTNLAGMSNDVYKQINEMTTQYVSDGEITTFGSKIEDIWNKLVEKKNRGESYGLPSFFPALNEYFTYEETELVVIASRMKMGKSFICMIEALHKAMNGVPTFVQDSEMSDENWYIRVIAYLTGISTKKIKDVDLTPDEMRRVNEKNEYIKSLPLYHNFDPYMTKEKFYSICAQKKTECGIKFIVWDYIKCDDSITVSSERSAYMAGMTNFLKNIIAGDLKMSVLAFCQLNRNNEVAESDGIERNCSVSVYWGAKTEEEMIADGAACGTHKFTVKLNRLGKQHLGSREYIDMKFVGGDRVGIIQAEQHTDTTPFD